MNWRNSLFSGWFMGLLLLIFAFAIGYATFVENDYGAQAAKYIIYNSTWFEILLLLMVVNFSGMIFTKKLYIKSKLNILIIHLALILIIIGAGITRYFGTEGMMHIREGETETEYRSLDAYLQIQLDDGQEVVEQKDKVILTSHGENIFSKTYNWKGEKIDVVLRSFHKHAEHALVPIENGNPYLSIIVGSSLGRQEVFLREGNEKYLSEVGFVFGDTTNTDLITIIQKEGRLYLRYPLNSDVPLNEELNGDTTFIKGAFNEMPIMAMKQYGDVSFVVKEYVPSGQIHFIDLSDEEGGTAMARLRVNGKEEWLRKNNVHTIKVNDLKVSMKFGNIDLALPFSLELKDFKLERYPGSKSPSSFLSDVILRDEENKVEIPYSIYMNHILNYGGYRFFQSSYDEDEKGTVLSVNKDYWGTFITYFGYTLLFASLLFSFVSKHSRFARISMLLKDVHNKRKNIAAAMLVMLFSTTALMAQPKVASEDHAAKFGQLLIQTNQGRIEPVNTMATKLLVKIHKKGHFEGLTADQVFLGIMTNPEAWKSVEIIKIGDEIKEEVGVTSKYASFNDFIAETGEYKIRPQVEHANLTKPAMRGTSDKEYLNVDERVNVFYMMINSSIIKIFPLEKADNNNWVNATVYKAFTGNTEEGGSLYEDYITSLAKAIESGDYNEADKKVEAIAAYQRQLANDIMPSERKVQLEILYNNANIFKRLFPYYMLLGSILVALFFIQTFKPKFEFKGPIKVIFWILLVAFILQAAGLALRWYISGHAPWSNGYESMIYISWATMLAGFLFGRRSSITLGVTSLITGIALLTAHMSWLNPEVTNLVPVLKSKWLTIHVATITASYGFLALGCMLAFLNLIIIIFRTSKNYERISLTLWELNLIIEMTLSIGLILLVIGNFLGAIWANESWGRYWGWDPKETWTLVTIILYTFTLHLTLIPAIRNSFTFNFFAFMSYGAVLMTYFGVNYYLSGLHSYAGGDSVQIPDFVYYTLVVAGIVSLLAAFNEFTIGKKLNKQDI